MYLLPRSSKVGIVVVLIILVFIIWYFDLGFAQEKIAYLFSPPADKLVTKELTKEEIKSLAKIPVLRPLNKPITSTNPTIARLLQNSDNVLLWQGNGSDITGRTILVDTNQNIHYLAMGFGGAINNFEASISGKTVVQYGFWREIGVFKNWVRIPNSKDLYAILSDPVGETDFLVRIARDIGDCSNTGNPNFLTDLIIQDINFTAERGRFNELGLISKYKESDLAKLIKVGDLVTFYNQQYSSNIKRDYNVFSRRDSNGVICANSLVMQRFGGEKQVEKELTRSISSVSPLAAYINLMLYYHDPRLEPLRSLIKEVK